MANIILENIQAHLNRSMQTDPIRVASWLGGIVRKAEPGVLELEFEVRQEMTNFAGTLHGGMIATMLDDVMGATVMTIEEEFFFTTVNLNVDYFYPARKGDKVTAISSITKKGKTIHHVECALWNLATGKQLALAHSNLMKTDFKISDLLPGIQR
ncbi:MAG: PaaI family thioesterase [Cytophagaceae bacterium]|jgi:uncharacterized protein (TIGR00369 family)|nr:PaaI family thioesterase [Cytophagaceae bacterium]